jgi:hypothetical protein
MTWDPALRTAAHSRLQARTLQCSAQATVAVVQQSRQVGSHSRRFPTAQTS